MIVMNRNTLCTSTQKLSFITIISDNHKFSFSWHIHSLTVVVRFIKIKSVLDGGEEVTHVLISRTSLLNSPPSTTHNQNKKVFYRGFYVSLVE